MPHAKTTPPRLRQLQQKHSDRSGRQERFQRRADRLSTVRTLHAAHKPSGLSFQSSRERLGHAATKQVFRQLYSFLFLELSLLFLWAAYRMLVQMPVWFDEGIAKAIVFGGPVLWFTARSKFMSNEMGLSPRQLIPGLYLGIAIGGLYGFAGVLTEVLRGREVAEAAFYLTSQFWWMAFLALLTAWWESLFFFGFPIQYVRSVASWFSEEILGGIVVILFLAFHAPLRLVLTGGSPQFIVQMGILTLFVIGQYVVYRRTGNLFALILSHFFWGMVIELYT